MYAVHFPKQPIQYTSGMGWGRVLFSTGVFSAGSVQPIVSYSRETILQAIESHDCKVEHSNADS